MRRLADTLARLAPMPVSRFGQSPAARLEPLPDFGANPGALDAKGYVPSNLQPGAALVVALHGCTQTADEYDQGTGWSTLADQVGFALLVPQQRWANNANACFNWFEPVDMARIGGEAQSIAQMVEAMITAHHLDRSKVFVTGLSAGGAMAAVMLATYPDVFAGGAIIGGLSYGCARSVRQALDRMRGHGAIDDAAAGVLVHRAAGEVDVCPTVSIWHGTADVTVMPSNMDRLAGQWRAVHRLCEQPSREERGANWHRRIWQDKDGRDAVETWTVQGMGHGVPINPAGPSRLGRTGPHMLDVGLSSTHAIAASWGLVGADEPAIVDASTDQQQHVSEMPLAAPQFASNGIQDTIENALRSAGLMQ